MEESIGCTDEGTDSDSDSGSDDDFVAHVEDGGET